jgi:hypothetical protein
MKGYKAILSPIIAGVLLAGATVHAQQRNVQLPNNEEARRKLEEAQNLLNQLNQARETERTKIANRFFAAWWTNPALVERLGLTEDQKARIERAYENHRLQIMSTTEQLEKEEALLKKLLEAEPLDRNAILAQIDRVVQARGELERTNSVMTLEMREVLTPAQWAQVPKETNAVVRWNTGVAEPGTRGGRGIQIVPVPAPGAGARRGGRQ